MSKIWLDGEILDDKEALINVMDRSVLYGDGVFETLRAYDGIPFRLDRHLRRLEKGCQALRMRITADEAELSRAISLLYEENVGFGDAYVRITVTGGLHDGGRTLTRSGQPRTFILVTPLPPVHFSPKDKGIRLCLASFPRNSHSPLSRIKSANYLEFLWARQEATDKGYDDALFLNQEGHLCEATTSNLFLIREGGVFTPGLKCGPLPGITRETVLELCRELLIPAREDCLVLDDLLQADEAFLTNSVAEVIPVREVEGRSLPQCPGPITKTVHEAYRDLVRKELGAKEI